MNYIIVCLRGGTEIFDYHRRGYKFVTERAKGEGQKLAVFSVTYFMDGYEIDNGE